MAGMKDRSRLAKEYLENVAGRNATSAVTYEQRLRRFDEFVSEEGIDATVKKLVAKKLDPYTVLSGFNAHMSKRGVAPRSQAQTVKTIKTFLDYSGVEISSARFKLKVMLPKIVKKQKLPLSKQEVTELIKMCRGNNRLYTYVMFLAATGCRAREALMIQNEDLHLDDPIQPYVFIKGENTKTKHDRTVYLTAELVQTLKEYLKDKYRERRTQYDHAKEQTIYAKFTPEQTPQDYVFYPYHHAGDLLPKPRSVYIYFDHKFGELLDRHGREQKDYKHRHKITFHSFRRFVKTTISSMGYEAYSERYIGHVSSINATYYNETQQKEIELFKKIEPYLTFLDIAALEARGAEIEARLEAESETVRGMRRELEDMKVKQEHTNNLLSALATGLEKKGIRKDEILDTMAAGLNATWSHDLTEEDRRIVEEYKAKKKALKERQE